MIIAVSVLIAEFTARNNFDAARQESTPQSATTYISEHYRAFKKTNFTDKYEERKNEICFNNVFIDS